MKNITFNFILLATLFLRVTLFRIKIAEILRSSGFSKQSNRPLIEFLQKYVLTIFPSSLNRILSCVRIAVSPQIAPISFGEEPANAGELVSVQCVVTKGDFPLEITWTFDGRPIQSYHSDVTVLDSGKRVKQLTIESVAARHAGEYTCVASNAAGSVSHSATLKVNGTSSDKLTMSHFRI